jgi:hypothetical protein
MKQALAVLCLLVSIPAAAQTPDRLPWFTVDVHAATVGLPQAEGWVPVVPTTTELPGRAWGFGFGGTVYPFRLGIVTFGVGASFLTGKGAGPSTLTTVTPTPPSGDTEVTTDIPFVETGMTSVAPQLSINFGRKQGWSYLSAGIGRSKVTSRLVDPLAVPSAVIPEAWNQALNFGGGVRWFMKPHIGAGFDVRFIKLSSRSPTETLPSAKRTQTWSISAGISIQ